MTQFSLRSGLITCCWVLAAYPAVHAAEDTEPAEQRLEQVGAAIGVIEDWLREADSRRSAEAQLLKQAELEVAGVSRELDGLRTQIADSELAAAELRQRQAQLQAATARERALLNQAIRAAYVTQQQNTLKTLLNQEDISTAARMLHYSRLFSAAQRATIEDFRTSLAQTAAVNAELEANLTRLAQQRIQLEQQAAAMSDAQARREAALAALNQDIASRQDELEQLRADQVELTALVEEIRRAMEGIRSFADVPPIAERRGRLPLPVAGPVISRFGSRYGADSLALSRQGITIGADPGSEVTAVHAGLVVFADWLRGTGLLVIVDHGDGYMSLYGANQSLAIQSGDWVDAGDILAASGSSGAEARPGLYFEIRHHGQAQDPLPWLAEDN